MSTIDDTTGLPAPEDFDLIGWLESGTVATRTVPIYNNPALIDELESLDKAIAAAEADKPAAEPVDAPMSDDVDVVDLPALIARRDEVEELLLESRSVWTVRALSADEVDGSFKTVPEPHAPASPKESAPQQARDKYTERLYAYAQRKARADADRRLVQVAAAVVRIETSTGSRSSVSVEALGALRAHPHGQKILETIYAAVAAATGAKIEISRPTSPGLRTSIPG